MLIFEWVLMRMGDVLHMPISIILHPQVSPYLFMHRRSLILCFQVLHTTILKCFARILRMVINGTHPFTIEPLSTMCVAFFFEKMSGKLDEIVRLIHGSSVGSYVGLRSDRIKLYYRLKRSKSSKTGKIWRGRAMNLAA